MQRQSSFWYGEEAEEKELLSDEQSGDDNNKEQAHEAKPPLNRIVTSMMTSKDVSELADDAMFQIGFARKDIVSLLGLQAQHSAVAFFDISAKGPEKWLVLGRQTPGFLKPEVKNAKQERGGLLHNYTSSTIDNEKRYNFFRESKFVPEMANAVLTGKEVKEITQNSDAMICKDRMFNLIMSNCYSASVSMLANAIIVIEQRKENTPEDKVKNDKSIKEIYRLIQSAEKDNLSLQIGVRTDPVVRELLEQVNTILEFRKLKPMKRSQSEELIEAREFRRDSSCSRSRSQTPRH